MLQTSSASNVPHQCGHMDMSEPLGCARIEEEHLPNHLHAFRSVGPPDRPAKLWSVARVHYPCRKLKVRILRSRVSLKKLAAARQKATTTTGMLLRTRSAARHQMSVFKLSPRRLSRLPATCIALLNSNNSAQHHAVPH